MIKFSMSIIRPLLLVLVLGVALVWASHMDWEIIRMSDHNGVTFTQMMADAAKARVIVVGETHDKKVHHTLQLDVIRDLNEKKKPLAIGLEMFQTDSQRELDDWVNGKVGEDEFRNWYMINWGERWSLYRDIFIYAQKHHIPMVALNIPMQIVAKVAREGFTSLSPEERANLPPEVSCELNTAYTAFLRETYAEVRSHAMTNKHFVYFCEAQSLRNNGMAWNIAHYLKANPGRQMVVMTGILHAVKTGIPDQLGHYAPLTYKVILPELPEFESRKKLDKETDYLIQ